MDREGVRTRRESAEASVNWVAARRSVERWFRVKLGGDEGSVDDLVQEACVRLLRAVRRGDVENVEALSTTICQRTFIDWIRRRKRWSALVSPLDDVLQDRLAAPPDPAHHGDPLERTRFVVLEFFEMTHAACRELAAAFYAGKTWRAVAREQGRRETAVRKQWSRCLERLRAAVTRDERLAPLREWAELGG